MAAKLHEVCELFEAELGSKGHKFDEVKNWTIFCPVFSVKSLFCNPLVCRDDAALHTFYYVLGFKNSSKVSQRSRTR